MGTEKLYFADSFLVDFAARVTAVGRQGDRTSVVLDRSAFFPEGGGQLADHGVLELASTSRPVVDVQIDEAGQIHHLLEGTLPEGVDVGTHANGRIDFVRRRDHMSQHTAQHMLSAALQDRLGTETVSARLGSTISTIDVRGADVPDAQLHQVEDRVNDVVLEDRPIRILFPDPEALAKLPLRRDPKVDSGVRVIEIEDFDRSPCGGTHCARTGQVGPIRIIGGERYKGLLRLSFLAGHRALSDARAKESVLAELARSFTCGPLDVGAAIGRLRADLKQRVDQVAALRGQLISLLSATLLAEHAPAGSKTPIVVEHPEPDIDFLRALAGALAARSDVVAFVGGRDSESGDWLLAVAAGADAGVDAGQWFKSAAVRFDGRGGGRSHRAEGRLSGKHALADIAATAQ